MTKEAGSERCYVTHFEDEGKGHKTRNVGSLQKLEKDKEMDSSLEPPEGI